MSNASNARSRIGIVPETTFGTTPPTPSLIAQRFSSASFTLAKPELQDDSKTGTRQYSYVKTGNESVSGTMSGPLAHDNYDTILASVMYSNWSSNVLKMGDTIKSFTLEEAQPDIGQYRSFRGTIANGFTIDAPIDGLSTVSFDFLSLDQDISTSPLDVEYTAQPFREPFTHCGGMISEGGSAIGYVSSVSLAVSNNLEHAFVWGGCSAADLVPGRVDVTGTLDVFFTDATLMNKFINGTYTSLSFTMSDGTNTLTFTVPRMVYTGADSAIDAGSGERLVSLPFRGIFDSTAASSLVITRSA